jgi:holo-[acyl-carrier protein] synthase
MGVRVGIDLVSVESVAASISAHGERYLKRVYTERELRDCAGPQGVDPERLAARFAAKEAVLKALRPGEVGVPLNAIEIRRTPEGWVEVGLIGAAADVAAHVGIEGFALSITHERGLAAAIVMASSA